MDKKNDSNKRKVDLNAENAMYKQETNCNSITNKIECTINTKLEGGKGHFSQNSEFFFATQEVLSKAQATIKKSNPADVVHFRKLGIFFFNKSVIEEKNTNLDEL